MTIKKILIVDDSKTEQIHLAEILESQGYVTQAASNADEARVMLLAQRQI